MKTNYYKILEINESSSDEDIKNAYRKLSKQYHPDKHMQESEQQKETNKIKFLEVKKAYDVLSDPKEKELHDLALKKATSRREYTINLSELFSLFASGKIIITVDTKNSSENSDTKIYSSSRGGHAPR